MAYKTEETLLREETSGEYNAKRQAEGKRRAMAEAIALASKLRDWSNALVDYLADDNVKKWQNVLRNYTADLCRVVEQLANHYRDE